MNKPQTTEAPKKRTLRSDPILPPLSKEELARHDGLSEYWSFNDYELELMDRVAMKLLKNNLNNPRHEDAYKEACAFLLQRRKSHKEFEVTMRALYKAKFDEKK